MILAAKVLGLLPAHLRPSEAVCKGLCFLRWHNSPGWASGLGLTPFTHPHTLPFPGELSPQVS